MLLRFSALLLLLFAGCQAHVPAPCSGYVRFSDKVKTLEFDAVGRVLTDTRMCTGTLVEKNVVLTAAHCVRGITSVSELQFVLSSGRAYKVLDGLVGQTARGDHLRDIALLKIEDVQDVAPIKIGDELYAKDDALAFVGHGCAAACLSDSPEFFGGHDKRVSYAAGRTYNPDDGISSGFRTCPGDSGGPIIDVKRNKVIAVASQLSIAVYKDGAEYSSALFADARPAKSVAKLLSARSTAMQDAVNAVIDLLNKAAETPQK